jgi:hypothetical protein
MAYHAEVLQRHTHALASVTDAAEEECHRRGSPLRLTQGYILVLLYLPGVLSRRMARLSAHPVTMYMYKIYSSS